MPTFALFVHTILGFAERRTAFAKRHGPRYKQRMESFTHPSAGQDASPPLLNVHSNTH